MATSSCWPGSWPRRRPLAGASALAWSRTRRYAQPRTRSARRSVATGSRAIDLDGPLNTRTTARVRSKPTVRTSLSAAKPTSSHEPHDLAEAKSRRTGCAPTAHLSRSQAPLDGCVRVRLITAPEAGAHVGREVARDHGVGRVDRLERGRDRLADGDPGTLGAAAGRPCPPGQPDRGSDLRKQGIALGGQLLSERRVAPGVGLVELGVDLAEPEAVRGERLGVDHLPEAGLLDGLRSAGQVKGGDLGPGMRQQPVQVLETTPRRDRRLVVGA